MKKILASTLVLCMCLAALVACLDNNATNEGTDTKKPVESQTQQNSDNTDPDDTDPQETEPDDTDNGNGGEQGGNEPTPEEKAIEIGSVEEWEALAKDGDPDNEDFLGKTVKLTANIDFGSATATTLFKTFAGTFDGGNFTVKGQSVSRMSLIANTLDGATVKNLTVDGFTISPAVEGVEFTGVIAAKAVTTAMNEKAVTFENITVKNCSMDADKVDAGNMSVGIVLGEAANVNIAASKITVNACTVTGTDNFSRKIGGVVGCMTTSGLSTFEEIKVNMNVSARAFIGGIVGRSLGAGNLRVNKVNVTGTFDTVIACGGSEGIGGIFGAKYNEGIAAGESYVGNAYINVKLYCSSGSGRSGGIGNWYKNQGSKANITIENCYIAGEFTVKQGDTMKDRAAGLFGEYGSHYSTLTLKNVILEAAIGQTWAGSDVTPSVTVLGKSRDSVSDSWLINYASTNTTVDGVTAPSHTIVAENCYTTILKRSNDAALELIAGFAFVDPSQTRAMISYDANGFISAISAPAAS